MGDMWLLGFFGFGCGERGWNLGGKGGVGVEGGRLRDMGVGC